MYMGESESGGLRYPLINDAPSIYGRENEMSECLYICSHMIWLFISIDLHIYEIVV